MVPWPFSWPNTPAGQLRRRSNGNAVDWKIRRIVFMRGSRRETWDGGSFPLNLNSFVLTSRQKDPHGVFAGILAAFHPTRTRSRLNKLKAAFSTDPPLLPQ